jgi:hypothetical protein
MLGKEKNKKSFDINYFTDLYKTNENDAIIYIKSLRCMTSIDWMEISWIKDLLSENFMELFKDKLDWDF